MSTKVTSVALVNSAIDSTTIGSTTPSTAQFITPAPNDDSQNAATTAWVTGRLGSSSQNAGLASSRGFYTTPNPDTTPPAAPFIYQNTSGRNMLVTVSGDLGGGGFHGDVYCDANPSPTTMVAQFSRVNSGSSSPNFYPGSVTFLVLPNYYYGISVTSGSGSPFVRSWTEWTI